ncbi:O-methyltransferase [Paenibacillus sp. GYB003]|uniref:O-methyltransferase n=1 Tax=Paenibacillus sp. GYB003 TaxID=2994392 RepID=UPI002F9621F4
MNQTHLWNEVDRYMADRLIPRDDVLESVLEANRSAGLPPIDVTPAQGKLLHILARMQGAKRMLEIGTLGGYSTIWLARALPADGRLVTLESNPLHVRVAQANLANAGLDGIVTVRAGDALEQLARMDEERTEPFDFIFIDADKPNNPGYLQWALRFARPGTVIVGDNVVRDGNVIREDSDDPRVQGVRTFFDMLADNPAVTATAIQTVGSKGYDGFMIGIVSG